MRRDRVLPQDPKGMQNKCQKVKNSIQTGAERTGLGFKKLFICKKDHITYVVNCPILMKEQKGKQLKFLRGIFQQDIKTFPRKLMNMVKSQPNSDTARQKHNILGFRYAKEHI